MNTDRQKAWNVENKSLAWIEPTGKAHSTVIVCSQTDAFIKITKQTIPIMARAAQAVGYLADGYPGLALIASGMRKTRAERLSYAYRVDRLWPARMLRLSFYVSVRLGSRLSIWPDLAALTTRRLPMQHNSLRYVYHRSLLPATRPLVFVQYGPQTTLLVGPAQRRIQQRLELLRRATGGI